ncbi:MAG: hypothetical protein ATN35_12070 [Epulopiscium sp. Nele67-Bin004]|nr:MAG: hypothetical protein ATN35_12070 [Epulopiscium sp. Nele67-Bin004]
MQERILKEVPNMCTFANVVCGVMALMVSVFHRSQEAIIWACILIAIGGFFDAIDGRLARKLQVTSAIGKELDSFADMITFVIAPMCTFIAMHSMGYQQRVSMLEILVATFYISCGIYRLARYNSSDYTTYFEGLPTTASGFLMSVYIFTSIFLVDFWCKSGIYSVCSYVFIAICGLAMISTFKVKRI